MKSGKIIIVLKRSVSNGGGGIGHYYRSLRKSLPERFHYFHNLASAGKQGKVKAGWRLVDSYLRFYGSLLDPRVALVVLNPSLTPFCVARDLFFLMIAKVCRKKVVVFFRGWNLPFQRKIDSFGRGLFRFTFGKADAIIVLSDSFQKAIRRWGYANPVYIETTAVDDVLLENEFPTERFSRNRRFRECKPLNLLFLSRVERLKGVYEVLDAVEQINKTGDKVHLTLAGSGGELNRVKDYVQSKGIKGIQFIGYVVGEDKTEAYRKADLYLFPSSHGEGMPNSVLEAMAFGLPVITTSVGGIADFFENEKMGYVLQSGSTGCLVHALNKVLDCPEKLELMGKYNTSFAANHFMASRAAKRIEGICDKVLVSLPPLESDSSWYSSPNQVFYLDHVIKRGTHLNNRDEGAVI